MLANRPDDSDGPASHDGSTSASPEYATVADKICDISRFGAFISDSSAVIHEMVVVFRDEKTTKSARSYACNTLELLANKMSELDPPAVVSAAAKSNRKVPAVTKAVAKLRNEEKKDSVADPMPASKRNKKSDAVKKVEAFEVVPTNDVRINVDDIAAATSTASLPVIPLRRTSPRLSIVPAPPNGTTYSPREVIHLLRSLPEEERTEAKQILRMEREDNKSSKNPRGSWVPLMKRQLNDFVKKWMESVLDPPLKWRQRGRSVYIEVEKLVCQVRAMLEENENDSVSRTDIEDLIIKEREKTLQGCGMEIRGLDLSPCPETLRIYVTSVMMKGGFKLCESVRNLPEHRIIAVNSKRNPVTQLIASAVSQSIKLPYSAPEERKLKEEASQGAKDLLKLVKEAEGTDDIIPCERNLVTSRDTVSFQGTMGPTDELDELRLTLPSNTGTTHSVNSSDGSGNSEQFRGIGISADTLITGGGMVAPILLTVKKVKSSQLPADACPEGFVFISCPYLAAGGDRDVYSKGTGYVAFIRDGDSLDVALFKEHWNIIQAPFLKELRKRAAPMVSEDDGRVNALLRSANYHDGGMPGMFAISAEDILEGMAMREEYDIKHPFGTSLIFQPSDLAKCYRTLKKLVKKIGKKKRNGRGKKRKRGALGSSSSGTGGAQAAAAFKVALKEAKEKYGLDLGSDKENSLVTVVGHVSYLIGEAFTTPVIQESFVEAGLLDAGALQYPDMYKILNNKKGPLPEGFVDSYVVPFFTELYLEMKKTTGKISENTFDRIDEATGFDTRDRDSAGNVVERTATIRNEWRERAKIVSHEEQRRLRKEEDNAVEEKAAADHASERMHRSDVRSLAAHCEDKLGNGWTGLTDDQIAAKLESRDIPAPMVEAFVKVRAWESCKIKKNGYKIAPRKGTAEKAKACATIRCRCSTAVLGKENCTIYQALELRSEPWKMQELPEEAPAPTVPTVSRGSAEHRRPVTIEATLPNASNGELPSAILGNETFIANIEKGEIKGADYSRVVPGEAKENADKLLLRYKNRLWERMQDGKRRLHPSKYDHWFIRLFLDNLPTLTAIDIKGGRVKGDVAALRKDDCFFVDPIVANFLSVRDEGAKKLHGSYMRFHTTNRRYFRGGKEYSENASKDRYIPDRIDEHIVGAKLLTDRSRKKRHYRAYCARSAKSLVSKAERLGYAEDVETFVGIGFNSDNSDTLTSNQGLFSWSESALSGLSSAADGCSSIESKKLNAAAFMFELLDCLKIPAKDDVGESFGAETYLG
eukprot:CAMPEP_0178665548 /NCGR_PEP_ID=MMETSP0698-20121128/30012_1 /TAXON_ID=265572 /ORGANISM="Extubocellulus spinifer, Strain CCMP396" /LENGTH=1270 /DNA_ID=CAMNT_0020308869 /DNA_START=177 /DNA_END=3986 /DNA_ORIENTATION=-